MKDSTVGDLEEIFRKAKSARGRLEPAWYLNQAYYQGEQWVAWDGRSLYRPRLRPDRLTIVDNRIQPIVRTEVAKLLKNKPTFTVTPNTADDEDVNAAQMAEQILRYQWDHLHLHERLRKALEWSRVTGAGFWKIFWDPSLGDGFDCVCDQDGKVMEDQMGRPMRADQLPEQLVQSAQTKKVNMGDIRVEVRSPFQMYPDPLPESFDECEWVIEESIKSIEYVQNRYGVNLKGDADPNPGLVEARLGMSLSPGGSGGYKGIKVKEYWCKPNSEHPKGRRAVWAAKQLLEEDNNPFDSLPYIMFSGIPIPGRLWPTSIVDQLRGQQTELNKLKSQIAENRNRIGNPTLLASKQAIQDRDSFEKSTTLPGGTYYFDDNASPNAAPQYLVAPPLPQYVLDEIDRIQQAFQEISGQHEVTSAQVPAGVTAASAISYLQEADDTRLGPGVADLEHQLARAGKKILNLVVRFYTDQRTIRIAGDEDSWEIFDFKGAMLRDNTHVEVQTGSAFPHSKAAKQAAMQDLLTFFVQSGNPPHGRSLAQFLKDWDFGGAERLLADFTRDETQVNRENKKLSMGVPVQVNDYDNDQSHIDGHEDFEKSAKFENLDPQIRQLFEQHVAEHRQRLAQQQQMALMQQTNPQQALPPDQQQMMQQAQGEQQLQGQQDQQAGQAAQLAQQLEGQQGQQQLSQMQGQQLMQHRQQQHEMQMEHQRQQHEERLRQSREAHAHRMSQQARGANGR